MAIDVGSRLGAYEVTAKLGEGGMGEVWRARDTKLDRDVALKVLPEAFTSDPDRLARFEREAKVLAALNHPNIGGIHGFEESGDVRALVLELVEGPTIADRIKEGSIPVDEAIEVARQIADALEAAHEQGIIHRDLKPANIKLRPDGTVKVLDFGLAKALQPEQTDPSLSGSPTISLTAAATQMGMVIGTAAYMAPEQAKGLPVDKRADIWAFGAVLFEMVSGRRLFEAGDVSEMLASVLVKDPDISSISGDVPEHVRSVVRHCLVKDPKDRLRDIGDVRLALKGTFETTGAGPRPAVVERSWWQRPVPATGLVLATAALSWFAGWSLTGSPAAPADVVRFSVEPSAEAPLRVFGLAPDVAISPDGRRIVYQGSLLGTGTSRIAASSVSGPTATQLNVRSVDQLDIAPLRGGTGIGPFFSADGESVGFFDATARRISRVSIFGGPPVTVVDSPSTMLGASWGGDDQIVFSAIEHGLFRVSGGGGEPELLAAREEGGPALTWPSVIPNRDAVLLVLTTGDDGGQLAVLELATGAVTPLGLGGVAPRYVASGHLVYADAYGAIRAAPFDVETLEVTGSPVALIEGVYMKLSGAADFSISDDGRLVYVVAEGLAAADEQATLAFVDMMGNPSPLSDEPRDYNRVRASPDDNRLAVEVRERGEDAETTHIWTVSIDSGIGTQLTFEGSRNGFPVWTPDGQAVVFVSDRAGDGAWGIYRKAADGSGDATLLWEDEGPLALTDVSREGVLAFQKPGDAGRDDIWTMELETGAAPVEFLASSDEERAARFSPDGRWIAYQADGGDGPQVYVRPYPRTEGSQRRISEGAGRAPIWSPAGDTLYFAGLFPVPLYAAPIQTAPSFVRGRPEELFLVENAGYLTSAQIFVGPLWDIAPTGDRFVMVQTRTRGAEVVERRRIHVVLNWFEELKERVPVE